MIEFVVYGQPAPGGSKRGFYNHRARRVIITDDSARSRPWKAQVSDAAADAMAGRELEQGPVAITIRFYLPRPKGHYGTGANGGRVRPSAPTWPAVKPDVDKLSRTVLDAMTGIVYRDDAQVVVKTVEKHYGQPARAELTVQRMERYVSEALVPDQEALAETSRWPGSG